MPVSRRISPYWQSECARATVYARDYIDVLFRFAAGSVDAVITDPPYGLEFMGKEWDKFGDNVGSMQEWHRQWAEAALRILKPGGYLLSFGGTRTWHRLACALEDAGWEMRDTLMWIHGQGFPKGDGCLKPSWEPIVLARKPGKRVLPLPGLDECRVATMENCSRTPSIVRQTTAPFGAGLKMGGRGSDLGRWPPNLVLLHYPLCRPAGTGESGCVPSCPARLLGEQSGERIHGAGKSVSKGVLAHGGADDGLIYGAGLGESGFRYGDTGSAARYFPQFHWTSADDVPFFYCPKASRAERERGLDGENIHPTVKPLTLMRWCAKLVTPPGGTVLDLFMGSGTTGCACALEGLGFIGIEKPLEGVNNPLEYVDIAVSRIKDALGICPPKVRQSAEIVKDIPPRPEVLR